MTTACDVVCLDLCAIHELPQTSHVTLIQIGKSWFLCPQIQTCNAPRSHQGCLSIQNTVFSQGIVTYSAHIFFTPLPSKLLTLGTRLQKIISISLVNDQGYIIGPGCLSVCLCSPQELSTQCRKPLVLSSACSKFAQ